MEDQGSQMIQIAKSHPIIFARLSNRGETMRISIGVAAIILGALLLPPISLAQVEQSDSHPAISRDQLVEKRGQLYEVNSKTPYTGLMTIMLPTTRGKFRYECQLVNGWLHGVCTT